MKKKLKIIIIMILIIIAVIFGLKKINDSKIKYKIEDVDTYNYLQYYENEKYGIIDRDGNILIEANYKNILIPNPEEDVFICYDEENNTKVLNSKGEELFTKYDKVEPIRLKNIASVLCYEKSVLKYEKDGKYGIINFKGKELTKNIYDSIENLQSTEGKLQVSKDGKYGVINIKGTTLVEAEYDSIRTDGYYTDDYSYIEAGFIVSKTTDDGYKYGYINYKGKSILDVKYNEIIRIDLKDVYLIASENGQYGLYKNSKEIIKPEYQSIVYNDNGLLTLEKNKKYGMADLKGNIKIQLDYTEIEQNGIYIYAKNANDNVVYDAQGNKVDISYNKSIYETDNENYYISTILNNNITYYGIQNKDNTTLVNEGYRYIEYVYGGYFIAKDEKGNMGIINASGQVELEFKYSFIQKIKDKDMIQISDGTTTYIYSSNLKNICKMENAIIDNQEKFIRVYNSDTTEYFDADGNKISEDADVVKEAALKEFPKTAGDYQKTQYSLDKVYYIKD